MNKKTKNKVIYTIVALLIACSGYTVTNYETIVDDSSFKPDYSSEAVDKSGTLSSDGISKNNNSKEQNVQKKEDKQDHQNTKAQQENIKHEAEKKSEVKKKPVKTNSSKTTSFKYTGSPVRNLGKAKYTKKELSKAKKSYKTFSDLDSLGRCGTAEASVGPDLLPTSKRTSIGMVKPSGWHTVRYDGLVSGNYLYNRCHLIAFCLSGENANPKNLITGTRYLNVNGMLPYEEQVVRYVEKTGHHVLYKVTPDFKRNELVARGVYIRAQSVEDNEIDFKVYCFNVQPGVNINYLTGESERS